MSSENASTVLKKAIKRAHATLEDVGEKFQSVDKYTIKIRDKVTKYETIHESICDSIEKINELEHLVEYYRVLQDIQDISAELSNCIHSKEDQKIVNLFLSLSGSPESSDSVVGRLQDVDAPHMKLYARRMALYWHDVIKDKLSR